jgi:hypothetical protein
MQDIPLKITAESDINTDDLRKISPARVGVYQNWGGNMQEGWMRFVLDEFRIPYRILHNREIREKNMAAKFDVLLFNNVSKERLHNGKIPQRYRRWYSPLPEKYRGGIEKEGFDNLVEFLKKGKTLVFIGSSCQYAIEKFSLPVADRSAGAKIVCPNSYLNALVKETPLTYGMQESVKVMFDSRTPFFRTSVPANPQESRRTSLVFPQRDLLASGWLGDETPLARMSLAVTCDKYQGKIVLIGPDIIYRGQSEGTYKLLFNSLYLPTGR